jgi:cell division protein FtsI (penicillin-binding protein 3)
MAGMLALVGVVFAAVAGKLVYIQGVSADRYLALARSQQLHTVYLAGERGSIFDRNGHELAVSIPQSTIWANPHLVTDARAAAQALAPILGLDPDTLQQKLSTNADFVYLARKIDDDTAAKVKDLQQPGVFSLQESKRFLPDGPLAMPVIGTVGTDNTGLSGLEAQYERSLSGRPGKLIEEMGPRGTPIPGGLDQYQPPVRGRDLVLTIDQSLQYQTEQALAAEMVASKAKGATALVMDSQTGDLLAVADLTQGASGPEPTASARAFTGVYEPGSVNKLVTISAALASGVVTPTDRFRVPDWVKIGGTVFHDAEPHPVENWTVTDILANSSNVGTIAIATKLGREQLDQYLRSFGFGAPTALHYPGESAGLLINTKDWSGTSIATVPIGQGLAVTAVQMLSAYNTIANGGIYVTPKLIKATVDSKGHSHATATAARRPVVSPWVAADMTTMLGEVVRVGTGTDAKIDGYTVAGKTGTAKVPLVGSRGYKDGVYSASFAGFVPAERPALTAIVILDETPEFGGSVAAPVFAAISRYALREFRIPPQPPQPPAPGVPLATAASALGGQPTHSSSPSRPVSTRPSPPASPATTTTLPLARATSTTSTTRPTRR